jgi:hypothetical protein
MIDSNTIHQIEQSSIKERIRFMGIILKSFEDDIDESHGNTHESSNLKPFKIRKFSLGQEVHIDRDELYSDRL